MARHEISSDPDSPEKVASWESENSVLYQIGIMTSYTRGGVGTAVNTEGCITTPAQYAEALREANSGQPAGMKPMCVDPTLLGVARL